MLRANTSRATTLGSFYIPEWSVSAATTLIDRV